MITRTGKGSETRREPDTKVKHDLKFRQDVTAVDKKVQSLSLKRGGVEVDGGRKWKMSGVAQMDSVFSV